MNLTKHVCDLYTKNYKKEEEEEENPQQQWGQKHQQAGPVSPTWPPQLLQRNSVLCDPKIRGHSGWEEVALGVNTVNAPNSPKPSPGEAKAAHHCPGAQGPWPLGSLESMAELASFSSCVAYMAPNRARHHPEQHQGSSMTVAGCVSTRVCSPHQRELCQQENPPGTTCPSLETEPIPQSLQPHGL